MIATIVSYAGYRAETGHLYKGAIGKFAYETTERDVNRAFELAQKYPDPKQLRAKFYETFTGGCYVPYGMSTGTEIVSKGLAIFALHQGDPRAAIITAANFGAIPTAFARSRAGYAALFTGLPLCRRVDDPGRRGHQGRSLYQQPPNDRRDRRRALRRVSSPAAQASRLPRAMKEAT